MIEMVNTHNLQEKTIVNHNSRELYKTQKQQPRQIIKNKQNGKMD